MADGVGRRGWMGTVIGVIMATISGAIGTVLGGAVLSPAFAKRKDNWVPAAKVPDLQTNVPTPVTLRVTRQDGYYEAVDQQVVYLIKTASGEVRALASTCTHLGCRTSYDPATKQIKCPCHGGVFTPEGRVVGGPPPKPLAELTTRIDGGRVLVQV